MFNVFVWVPQHMISHHQYTNDHELDVDVHHFSPARLAAAQPAKPPPMSGFNEGWTFVWKGCLTTLGTCILQPLRTLTEKPTPNFDVNITPVPAAVSKPLLLLSMLPSFFVLLYPLLTFGSTPLRMLFLEIWPWVGMSIIWTAMTQTSHVQEQCQPREAACWTSNQIQTSLDYSIGDPVATALTAGLNCQGLHHALPTVCACHFPAMYDEYASICAKHGVERRTSPNLWTASADCLRYVFKNNRVPPPEPPHS